jgi:hypothetical protein
MKTFELPTCHQTQTTKEKIQKLKGFQNLECKEKNSKVMNDSKKKDSLQNQKKNPFKQSSKKI